MNKLVSVVALATALGACQTMPMDGSSTMSSADSSTATAWKAKRGPDGVHPDLNGVWDSGDLHRSEHVHLGVAIALRGGGLVAPAIHDADTLALADLMAALRDLVGRARAGRLRSSEMSDPTVTVTNFGDQGVDVAFPVIYPPQVALVGFGTPRLRSMIVDGALAPRMAVTATLSADHRVSDGRHGATLLTEFDRRLREPEAL